MSDALFFGPWLKQRRRRLDLTQEALARQASCSTVTIKKIEAGDLLPSKQLAELLGRAVNVPSADQSAFIVFARSETATASPAAFAAAPAAPVTPPPAAPPYSFLPAALTEVVGREREIATVCRLLRQPPIRLLTLTGPPGTGKTRLSLEVAAQLFSEFADRVCFVPLAPISTAALVPAALATALGVRETPSQPLLATLQAFLKEKQILLVLDNFEQVVSAALVVSELLTAAPRLKVLVSSREVLNVYGEQEFPLPPLAIPDINHLPPVAALEMYSAIELFVQRAQACKPDFSLTAANAPAVAEICAWLDGLPLAIEMAAARIKWTAPAQLLTQLSQRLALFTSGPRDLTPRQQTLRGAIDWSYDLLDQPLRQVFTHLAVFVGSAAVPAIAAVCGLAEPAVVPMLQLLVDKSLLRYQTDAAGEARFLLLETMREYASEKLVDSGAHPSAQQRHASYYCSLAADSVPYVLSGEQQIEWLDRLEADYPNIRAALTWTLDTAEDATIGLRFVDALYTFWNPRSYFVEGRRWMEAALARSAEPTLLRARVLSRLGTFVYTHGDLALSVALQEQALAIQEMLGDKREISRSLQNLGIAAGKQGDYTHARTLFERSLELERSIGQQTGISVVLNNLAIVAQRQHDYVRAEELLSESILIKSEIGDTFGMATALHTLGSITLQLGKAQQAQAVFRQSLTLRQTMGDRLGMVSSLERLAEIAVEQQHFVQAARWLGACQELRRAIAVPVGRDDQVAHESLIATLKAQLPPAEFTAAGNSGSSAPFAEIVASALGR